MRGEISADGKDSLGAHRLKLVEKLLDVVKELQVSAVILFNKSCMYMYMNLSITTILVILVKARW